MKDIKTFIYESQSELISTIKKLMSNVDYSKLKSYNGEQDPNRFKDQKENELEIFKNYESTDLTFVGTPEYYNIETGKKFENLSSKEQADYDAKNGDIIALKDNKVAYKIDVKISDKYLGSISLGSLANFDENGYYLLICKDKGKYKIVSHKDVVNNVKSGKLKLNEPIHKYKGYDIKWDNEDLTSEYFIRGLDLEKL